MNETEYRLRLKGEIDIEADLTAPAEKDANDKTTTGEEAINNKKTNDFGKNCKRKEKIAKENKFIFI